MKYDMGVIRVDSIENMTLQEETFKSSPKEGESRSQGHLEGRKPPGICCELNFGASPLPQGKKIC